MNMKLIFIEAHRLTRIVVRKFPDAHYRVTFGACIKLAIEDFKNNAQANDFMALPALIGTEKQVAWANKIRLDFINAALLVNSMYNKSEIEAADLNKQWKKAALKAAFWIEKMKEQQACDRSGNYFRFDIKKECFLK